MAEYTITYVQRKDFDDKLYKDIYETAKGNIASAKPEDILMLQIKFNSPTMIITKALIASTENLPKITEIED